MTIIEKLTKNIIDKSIKVKESGTMCNIGFVSPAMKKLSSSEAQKRIEKYDDVYELFDDNTYKKCDIANFSHNKMYGVMYGDKFSFREHLVNEYRVTGRVLFCKGTDDVCIKIRLAYEWLLYIAPELTDSYLKKCNGLINRIKETPQNLEDQGKICGNTVENQKVLIKLWDDIQIFFQEICPDKWYFIKKEFETYLFVYIK